MNIISQKLAEHNLKVKEFIEFLKVTEGHYFYAVKKNDPIYMEGLQVRLSEFIDRKIVELQKEKDI